MVKSPNRDDFTQKIKDILAKRASYICSNPECRCLTLCPDKNPEEYIYIGIAAHITAAAKNGARYDNSIEPEERSSIENGIFLCSNCAIMIDKNQGKDFSVDLLRKWKEEHENWVKDNLNKNFNLFSIIDGEIHAIGKENVTGIKTQRPVEIRPGTKITAEGEKNVTGALFANKERR